MFPNNVIASLFPSLILVEVDDGDDDPGGSNPVKAI